MYPEDLDIITVGQKSKAAPLVQGTVPSRKAKVTQLESGHFFFRCQLIFRKTFGKIG